ncbi:hypothetical protein [Rochambeau virus]|uniref:Uncharacterized protein n=1 Tax=Rochambeau virus TaxID=380435 RepID=A0A0D3R221_9RHAB|nr:hypothetical protein [Rochambeau virus]AJR28505.1 hypothetical protein [Rochambeau virus]
MIRLVKSKETMEDYLFYRNLGERLVDMFPELFFLSITRSDNGVVSLDLNWRKGTPILLIPRRLKTQRRFVSYRPGRDIYLVSDFLYGKVGLKKSQIDCTYSLIMKGKAAIISIHG